MLTKSFKASAFVVIPLLAWGITLDSVLAQARPPLSEETTTMCTMDAFECPDGTFVGRTGPNCEFVCPTGNTTSTRPAEARDDQLPPRATNVNNRLENVRENIAERQITLSATTQQRIKNLAANISNRLEAAITRLTQIHNRLESRIQKMKAGGVDTTAAEASLLLAKTELEGATALLSNIDLEVHNATTANTPVTLWQDVKKRYQDAATLIRSAHANLRKAIAELKAAAAVAATAVRNNDATTSLPVNQ